MNYALPIMNYYIRLARFCSIKSASTMAVIASITGTIMVFEPIAPNGQLWMQ